MCLSNRKMFGFKGHNFKKKKDDRIVHAVEAVDAIYDWSKETFVPA